MKGKVLIMALLLMLTPSMAQGEEVPQGGETVKIGTLIPLTGWGAPYGERLQKAYSMAVEEINAKGGIGGRRLELVIKDSQGKPVRAVKEARALIDGEGVLALVGGWSSDIAWAVAQVAQEKKVPYLLDHPSWDRLTRQGFQYLFRLQPTWGMYPRALEDFLLEVVYPQENRPLRVAYLYIDNPFAQSVWEYGLKPFFKSHRNQFELVTVEPYQGVALDFRLLLLKVKATHPDVVIFTSFLRDAVLLAREAREVGISPLLFSGVAGGHSVKEFIEGAREAGEGYFTSAPWRGDPSSPQWKEWVQRWEERYGEPPGEMEAEAYSAIYVLAQALEEVKSWNDPETARQELTRALAQTDMETVFGHVKFQDFNGYTHQNRASQMTALYQWQEGQLYQVWPPSVAERPFIYPYNYLPLQGSMDQNPEKEGGQQP